MTDISHVLPLNVFAMLFLLAMIGIGYLISRKGK